MLNMYVSIECKVLKNVVCDDSSLYSWSSKISGRFTDQTPNWLIGKIIHRIIDSKILVARLHYPLRVFQKVLLNKSLMSC